MKFVAFSTQNKKVEIFISSINFPLFPFGGGGEIRQKKKKSQKWEIKIKIFHKKNNNYAGSKF